MHTVALKLQF